mmetsp:Transcript_92494/g.275889  ORF Transcript_92494/g.275889 Transcript_92494/m.275889 type:complete len:203 (-) Transcript_92494:1469-2077(-)
MTPWPQLGRSLRDLLGLPKLARELRDEEGNVVRVAEVVRRPRGLPAHGAGEDQRQAVDVVLVGGEGRAVSNKPIGLRGALEVRLRGHLLRQRRGVGKDGLQRRLVEAEEALLVPLVPLQLRQEGVARAQRHAVRLQVHVLRPMGLPLRDHLVPAVRVGRRGRLGPLTALRFEELLHRHKDVLVTHQEVANAQHEGVAGEPLL